METNNLLTTSLTNEQVLASFRDRLLFESLLTRPIESVQLITDRTIQTNYLELLRSLKGRIETVDNKLQLDDFIPTEAPGILDPSNPNYFYNTTRDRSVFSKNRSIGYLNSLYGLLNDFSSTTSSYLRSILNDKGIVLLGGGLSKVQQGLHGLKVYPDFVVNLDPYVEDNPINVRDELVKLNAADPEVIKEVSARTSATTKGIEVWMLYSIPFYLRTQEEITGWCNNLHRLLEMPIPVTARIAPLFIYSPGEDKNKLYEPYHDRAELIAGSLYLLQSRGFRIYKFGGEEETVVIRNY